MKPTQSELLARIADDSLPLAQRLAAAQEVEHRLQSELEHRCEAVFGDHRLGLVTADEVGERSTYEHLRADLGGC